MLHFRPSQLQREEKKYKDAHWKVLANTKICTDMRHSLSQQILLFQLAEGIWMEFC